GTGMTFSRDGKRLATAGFQTVKVWDAASGKELRSIRAHDYLIKGVAFSPDGRRLATASGTLVGGGRRAGGEVKVWDADTGKELLRFADLPQWANSVAFSPDGKYLAAGTGDLAQVAPSTPGEVRVWDAATGKEILTLTGHTFWVTAVAFSPDSKRLASGSADRTGRVWDAPSGREVHPLRGHSSRVRGAAFSERGDRIASAGGRQGAAGAGRGHRPGPPHVARAHRAGACRGLQPRRPAPCLRRRRREGRRSSGLGPHGGPVRTHVPRPHRRGHERGVQPGREVPGIGQP